MIVTELVKGMLRSRLIPIILIEAIVEELDNEKQHKTVIYTTTRSEPIFILEPFSVVSSLYKEAKHVQG